MSSIIFLFSLAATSSESTRLFNSCDGSKENADRKEVAVVAPLHLHIGTPLVNGYQFDNFADAKAGIREVIREANKFLKKHLNFQFDVQSIKEYEHECADDPNEILVPYHDREVGESNEFHHLFTHCPDLDDHVVGLAAKAVDKEDFCEHGFCTAFSTYQPLKEINHDTHKVHLMDAWRFLHEVGHNFGAIHETTKEIGGLMSTHTPPIYNDSFYKQHEADFTLDAENKCYVQKMISHALKKKYAGFQEVEPVEKEEDTVANATSPSEETDKKNTVANATSPSKKTEEEDTVANTTSPSEETEKEDTDEKVTSPSKETDKKDTDTNVTSPSEKTDEKETDVDIISTPEETDEKDTDVDIISPAEETAEEDADVDIISPPKETDEKETDVDIISTPEETDEKDTDVDIISPPEETDEEEIPKRTPDGDSANKPDSTDKPVTQRKGCFRGNK